MHYYSHHIGDFVRDTARLTDSQCMAYLRMLWSYYETEVPLDSDVNAIAFKIGANASDVHQIIRHYFFEHEGKWHHARCDREILKMREKSEKAKKSANARWENANALRTQSECNADEPSCDATQYPLPNNQINTYVASKLPTCPHQEILSLFADVLPELPQPRIWEGTREKNLAARWKWVMEDLKKKGKEQTKEAGLDFFRRMFGYIKESDFLMGRNASWSADLGWIVKGENFSKIIDGNYENKVAA